MEKYEELEKIDKIIDRLKEIKSNLLKDKDPDYIGRTILSDVNRWTELVCKEETKKEAPKPRFKKNQIVRIKAGVLYRSDNHFDVIEDICFNILDKDNTEYTYKLSREGENYQESELEEYDYKNQFNIGDRIIVISDEGYFNQDKWKTGVVVDSYKDTDESPDYSIGVRLDNSSDKDFKLFGCNWFKVWNIEKI